MAKRDSSANEVTLTRSSPSSFDDLAQLLPVRRLVVTLRFTDHSKPGFFHYGALYGFVRTICNVDDAEFERSIRLDVPETARVDFQRNDYYRFCVIGLRGSELLLQKLIRALKKLPRSYPKKRQHAAFRNNLVLEQLACGFSEQRVDDAQQLKQLDFDTLTAEATLWRAYRRVRLRFETPLRLLREAEERKGKARELQFCRDAHHVTAPLILERLLNVAVRLLTAHKVTRSASRLEIPDVELDAANVFWIDLQYRNQKAVKSLGGLLGEVTLRAPAQLPLAVWQLLVFGQYVGIGQRSGFGLGRYSLISSSDSFSYLRPLPASSLLARVEKQDNLVSAWRHVHSKSDVVAKVAQDTPSDERRRAPVSRLKRYIDQMYQGGYIAPELRGYLIDKPDGGKRAIAVSPFTDRVLQRAVAQVLTPAFDTLMYRRSYGYRSGRSRVSASLDIQSAWREGYRWVFESDIENFFDSVCHERLRLRLEILLGRHEPLVECILRWVAAPVRFRDRLLQRQRGLPQGSPLSPLLANLMLDDFDQDMRAHGFRLVRYADDFVILCKSKARAEEAAKRVRQSLAEHGLSLKDAKTQISESARGFHYLGYLFVNDMVLDVGGREREATKLLDTVHPWLAALEQKNATPMDPDVTMEKTVQQHRAEPVEEANQSTSSWGALVCVTGEPSTVATRGEHIQVIRNDQVVVNQPWSQLAALILMGAHQISTQAMKSAMKAGVCVHLTSQQGSYRGALWSGGADTSGSMLWVEQIRLFNDQAVALRLARTIIDSRIRHQAEVLRTRGDHNKVGQVELLPLLDQVAKADSLDQLRGYEGMAAKHYFAAWRKLLDPVWGFKGRNRRPPLDPVNVMLSLGYTVLYGWCDAISRASGLYPWQGFLHQGRGRHAALASDMMEPFRHVVERCVLTRIALGQVSTGQFTVSEDGCYIDNQARREFVLAVTKALADTLRAHNEIEAHAIQTHVYNQTQRLKRFITDDEPFIASRFR